MRRPTTSVWAVVLAAGLALGACAGDSETVDAAKNREIESLDAAVPTNLAGFRVEREDVADTLADARTPYFDAASLYSLREDDDLLQATLQIGRFAPDVDATDEDFRNLLLTNISTGGREFRMGDTMLYVTGADRQTLSIWFRDEYLLILSTRDGFESGRTLLREALEIQP